MGTGSSGHLLFLVSTNAVAKLLQAMSVKLERVTRNSKSICKGKIDIPARILPTELDEIERRKMTCADDRLLSSKPSRIFTQTHCSFLSAFKLHLAISLFMLSHMPPRILPL